MNRGGLVVAILASIAGFPFEPLDAPAWSGLFFTVWALGLVAATGLLAVDDARAGDDVAAIGFAAVALYGVGTTLNSSLLARGLAEASVGVQPGVWAMLALGLGLLALSRRLPVWVRVTGLLAGVGHAVAATAVLFGAELPPTGGEPTEWPSLVVAVSKLALWAAMIGWILTVRRRTGVAEIDAPTQPGQPVGSGR